MNQFEFESYLTNALEMELLQQNTHYLKSLSPDLFHFLSDVLMKHNFGLITIYDLLKEEDVRLWIFNQIGFLSSSISSVLPKYYQNNEFFSLLVIGLLRSHVFGLKNGLKLLIQQKVINIKLIAEVLTENGEWKKAVEDYE